MENLGELASDLMTLHLELKDESKKLKNKRGQLRDLKNKLGEAMRSGGHNELNSPDYVIICADKKKGSTLSRKHLEQHVAEYVNNNDLSENVDVEDLIRFLFNKKPEPKKDWTLSIRKKSAKRKREEAAAEEVGEDLDDAPAMPAPTKKRETTKLASI